VAIFSAILHFNEKRQRLQVAAEDEWFGLPIFWSVMLKGEVDYEAKKVEYL
jgi:hypothetical protein